MYSVNLLCACTCRNLKHIVYMNNNNIIIIKPAQWNIYSESGQHYAML